MKETDSTLYIHYISYVPNNIAMSCKMLRNSDDIHFIKHQLLFANRINEEPDWEQERRQERKDNWLACDYFQYITERISPVSDHLNTHHNENQEEENSCQSQDSEKNEKLKKEIIVKRVSAFKFEIKVADETPTEKPEIKIKTPESLNLEVEKKLNEREVRELEPKPKARQVSVIQRAPPSKKAENSTQVTNEQRKRNSPNLPFKKRINESEFYESFDPNLKNKTTEANDRPLSPIESSPSIEKKYGLKGNETFRIDDAILRRIVEILLWLLLGDVRLKLCGHPYEPIHRVVWNAVQICCYGNPEISPLITPLNNDHDCGKDMTCFLSHVSQFLDICVPTEELRLQFSWTKLRVDSILRKLYFEEIIPCVRELYIRLPDDVQRAYENLLEIETWKQDGHKHVMWLLERRIYLPFVHNISNSRSLQDRNAKVIQREEHNENEVSSIRNEALNANLTEDSRSEALVAVKKQESDIKKEENIKNGPISSEQEREKEETESSKQEKEEKKPVVKKRGRPASTINRKIKTKRVLLWKFVYNLVEDPKTDDYIRWMDRKEGIFQILNSEWLAKTWGKSHGNPRMTYEKMARAMRTYYRSKVLQPVPRSLQYPRKLIYRINPRLIQD